MAVLVKYTRYYLQKVVVMKFKVSGTVDLPVESFVVEIKTMTGDGDGYSDLIVGSFSKSQKKNLQSIVETLNRMKSVSDVYCFGYESILGFLPWFSGLDSDDEIRDHIYNEFLDFDETELEVILELSKGFRSEWMADMRNDDHTAQTLISYDVFYYDANRVKHNVIISS